MNWPFWLEVLARSGALLLAGEALRRASKPAGAAFRHRLLLWVLALLAMLPALSAAIPEIPIAVWRPFHEPRAYVTIQEISSRMLETPAERTLNWPVMIWAGGVLAACVPLLVGAISAWRMARSAYHLENEARETVMRLAGKTEVLISKQLCVPVTCGLWRPRILLPAEAMEWSLPRLEAVLLHELAHIRRHDLAAQICAHLVAALWWFQPLVWLVRRRLRSESELACDAEVLRSGLKASEYATELLGIARTAGGDWRLFSSGIGMVRRGDLEVRLRAILQDSSAARVQPGSYRRYLAGFAVGVISVVASAASLHSGPVSSEQGGSLMKRTILSALLTSAGLSAATVGGYIHDTTGSAVAEAKVSIFNPDHSAKQETVTGADGKFSLNDRAAGPYILRIEKPGFTSIFREFDLKADSTLARDFTMVTEGGAGVHDRVIGSEENQPKVVRVGGRVAQSNLIDKVQPVYPPSAKQAHVQGTVELDATISKEGVPVDLRVSSSPSDDLSESALEAVRQWRYRPTLLNGQPVAIETTVIVNYTLSQ